MRLLCCKDTIKYRKNLVFPEKIKEKSASLTTNASMNHKNIINQVLLIYL